MTPAQSASSPVLLIGTEKGLFRIGADGIDGPHLAGYRVQHVVVTPGSAHELLAAVDHPVWGSHIHRSTDGGRSWTSLDALPQHPPGRHGCALQAVWHLAWTPAGDRLFAGVDPAGLFVSDDGGGHWADVPALNEHATRSAWEPSRGLYALHSICIDRQDPAHVVAAVSAGGAYLSRDGGRSWEPANAGVRAENLPERYPVAGHNVHRLVMHPRDGRRLYRQCYNGTYRSDDGGASWTEITAGLPSDFGYAIACDPFAPDTVWQIPESSSHLRTTVDGQLRVYRSDDAGSSWRTVSDGLPQRHVYVTVLRDAMDVDPASAGNLAFGTSSGHVFASASHGDRWRLVAEFLPRVLSVRYAAIAQ